ncbi:TPA: DUF4435 domain-containing protein [Providencia rettgeri]|nr:DUF4435 domain-containing protein [Providencia rettgeri]HEM8267872.1 DUF4435 domain-containing protein [Providencia rettgeri]
MSLINEMKKAKDASAALRNDVLLAKKNYSHVIVVEGDTDIGVYETLIKRINDNLNFTIVVARSKSQAIDFYKKINDNESEDFDYLKIIVDRDYDLEILNDDLILTLDYYSIESYLVTTNSLKSYLRDECKIPISKLDVISEIVAVFERDLNSFFEKLRVVSLPLFIIHNHEGKCEFYSNIDKLISINYGCIDYKENYALEVKNISSIEQDIIDEYKEIYNGYSNKQAIQGKYLYSFFVKWSDKLREFINNNKSTDDRYKRIETRKDMNHIQMRRFASIIDIPSELRRFL